MIRGNWYVIKTNDGIVDALYTGTTNDGRHIFRYHCQEKNKIIRCPETELENIIVSNQRTYNGMVKHVPKDTEINGLFLGWIWYIFIMIVVSIFNGAIIGWVVVSFFFFKWRKKIKEENTFYTKE